MAGGRGTAYAAGPVSGAPAPWASPLLLGHEAAEAAWLRALHAGRLPHAWLLTGPHGVGKATLAYRLARALLAAPAEAGSANDPASAIFRQIRDRTHPDLMVVDEPVDPKDNRRKSELPINLIRARQERAWRTAATGARLLLIDSPVPWNASSANALLKLLEEPQPGLVIVIIGQHFSQLPRTIVSRCARLVLRPLSAPLVVEGLRRLAPGIEPPRAQRLAELAHGSIGRALELDAIDWPTRYGQLLGELAGGPRQALGAAETLVKLAGEGGIVAAARLLGEIVRRAAEAAAGRPPALALVKNEAALLRGLPGAASLDRCAALWEKLAATAAETEALNLDPLLALIGLVHELVAPPGGARAAPAP